MSIIKLDAIDSTNDYLKQLAKEKKLNNYTVVIAHEQTSGKGQMGAKWFSEPGKNLTVSILVKDVKQEKGSLFDFNVAVTLGVLNLLDGFYIPNLNVKWPNDIMADGKKIGGILIENTLKQNGSFTSVVGIGLNLNQTNFDHLPQATSLLCLTGQTYEIETVALQLLESLKNSLSISPEILWERYLEALFKRNMPSAFEDAKGKRFMGIIQTVNHDGKLAVLLEDDLIHHYEVKEIKMLF